MNDKLAKSKQTIKILEFKLAIAMKAIENLRAVIELQKKKESFESVKEGLKND